MEAEPDQKEEALRLKTIAETKYSNSNIKSALKHAKKAHSLCPNLDGLSSLLTALKILRVASKTHSDITDWYKILQVEPFSHINTIKKQYKKLALILHPDKNPYLGCEEAFKLVGEGFRVLSDKIRRKEYDMRLRIKLQEERVNDNTVVETFWTACSRCRLLHQFERRYLGHNLVCPSCKKSFEAVEVEEGDKEDGIGAGVRIRSERLRRKVVIAEGFGNLGSKKKMGNDSRVKPRGGGRVDELNSRGNAVSSEKTGSMGLRSKVGVSQMGDRMGLSANLKVNERGSGAWSGGRLRTGGLRRKMSTVDEVLERSKPKRVKVGADMMTLAEMQLEAKKKSFKEKAKLKEKEKQKDAMKKRTEKKEKLGLLKKLGDTKIKNGGASKKSGEMDLEGVTSDESEDLGIKRRGASEKSVNKKVERPRGLRSGGLEIMAVKDSDFYDFDRDRVERSFKKGQVWALYDDDRIPRHYGLIDEVVSVNPFEVELSWLELQCNGNEKLICWEKMGFYMSCGRFKVSRKTIVNSLNIFSHVVDCERAAREVYRIYPKKGSVWALYNEVDLSAEARNQCARDKQCYEIVVFLTTYSEMHGLSMAYLEKVDGFKTVFKRREVGCHAIRWLENDDVRLLSHQIPARKLSADELFSLV
ncbi:uncharacterized protein LOC110620821 isoform X2 [Manihot esculenta]|uniref:Uncharacterized protein n=8 Tax=Manihot esculenta TaxID=3983 RepID=A0ACB7H9K6_MANES|nr:uncharacterized protein LOC110620821 isoform X2 [Manihot esculenta]XP_021620411.1 uncharacterized protein LOC110620821 isoform X2 [Manihot esculenta]XP_021620413.1 uncharacterized protein LOC110620821 isoform X2 [Manihot esculenta]XP_021620414.1 uncharacterized protein LOC110620821 isoform X2 [Manihot esculenta]XP_043814988.1 uncharacterized protein LOC110620821 isoform X2 [Manihot esculenta]XP_043814989.1 uncharacterized protein LOC110620821 isoform X2 [Manihot esculenta]KAG8648853.1 hypo